MFKKLIVVVIFIAIVAFIFPWAINAQTPPAQPSAAELLRRVDQNEIYTTIQYESDIIIENGGRRFVKTMNVWARGNTHSFIEFINPEDRGIRYLNMNGRYFYFSYDLEESIPMTSSMLKESMVGSDMSFQDAVDNAPLAARYTPALNGSEIIAGRDCWVLNLTARSRNEGYASRKLWIDKENGDLMRYELFGLSGIKLKDYELVRVEDIEGRRFPVEGVMRDLTRRNSKTTFVMRNVILNRPVADSVFSQRNLER